MIIFSKIFVTNYSKLTIGQRHVIYSDKHFFINIKMIYIYMPSCLLTTVYFTCLLTTVYFTVYFIQYFCSFFYLAWIFFIEPLFHIYFNTTLSCFYLWIENNPNTTGDLDVKNRRKKLMLGRGEKSHFTWWLITLGSQIGTGLLSLSPSLTVVWSETDSGGLERPGEVSLHTSEAWGWYKSSLQQTLQHHWPSLTTQNGRVFSTPPLLHTELLELPELRLWVLQHLISWGSVSYLLRGLLSFSPASKQFFSTFQRCQSFITSGRRMFPCRN